MRCAFLCHEFLLGGRKEKTSTVASHILIRSVPRVYENTYLLMCLFLLAVRNTPDKQSLFGLSGSAGGVWSGCCVLCFFHLLFGRFLVFWFRLFMIADGKLLFLSLHAHVQRRGWCSALIPAQTSSRPDATVLPLGKQEILWIFSAWWGPWALLNIF